MPVTTFLRDMFAPGYDTFPTKHVIFDFKKNKQRVAPFVAAGSGPINIRRDGFRTEIYEAPFINLSAPYDVDLLQTRLPGENVFGGLTPDERALQLMQQDYMELDDMITRREELMIAQMLQYGIATITGYVDDSATVVRTDTIDYGFENIINLTGADQWNQSTSKKYNDLEKAVTTSRQAGYNPTAAILGSEAWANMRADSNFMDKYMDLRYAQFGAINPQLNIANGNGYIYIGRLTELGLDLYRYDAWYFDENDGKMKPYISPEKVIVGPENIAERLYGANTLIPQGSDNFVTIEAPRATKVTIDRNNDTKSLIVKSRPVPQPFDVSAWAVINTVTT
ncbi:hypothetical protein ET33_26440 [Paenibacillus tyrfis]|uniref:Phage capsid protein n=2 Tax=Paenibacillus tyrfis TaxID=1501230 RepID=A0A081NV39_9BACL|nr:hypothetical protein ET33_26440 [Paenibacillus tyrfis]